MLEEPEEEIEPENNNDEDWEVQTRILV